MSKQPFILVYGRDLSLLETRCWVLEGASFRVRPTVDFEETMNVFRSEPPDLTILCHSLLPEQRKAVLAATRDAYPARKVLVLTGGLEAHLHDEETTAIDSFDGPRALLATVNRLLEQPAS